MYYRHGERYVTHPFSADTFLRDLYAASIADNAFVADSFVLSAVTFPVTNRSEYLFTKETVLFGPERPVINGFRFRHFTM
jgi:hypothetical protein